MSMAKHIRNCIVVCFVLNVSALFASADSLTLTTYYPAPNGAYDRLRLVPRANIAEPCQSGMLYVNSQNQLQFCQDNGQGNGKGSWGPVAGTWTQRTVLGDTSVFVINDSPPPPATPQPIYVGIGTSAPSSRLQIVGKGATNATSSLNITDSAAKSLLFVRDDGNVGIGTTSPSQKLHVVGNILVKNNVDPLGLQLSYQSNTGIINANDIWLVPSPTGGNIYLNTGGSGSAGATIFRRTDATEVMRIVGSSGNVGIGTTNPTQALDVVGSIQSSGNITAANMTATGTVAGAILSSTGNSNVGGTLTVGGNATVGGNVTGNIIAKSQAAGYVSTTVGEIWIVP